MKRLRRSYLHIAVAACICAIIHDRKVGCLHDADLHTPREISVQLHLKTRMGMKIEISLLHRAALSTSSETRKTLGGQAFTLMRMLGFSSFASPIAVALFL
jgi:hypothetical protein